MYIHCIIYYSTSIYDYGDCTFTAKMVRVIYKLFVSLFISCACTLKLIENLSFSLTMMQVSCHVCCTSIRNTIVLCDSLLPIPTVALSTNLLLLTFVYTLSLSL